MHPRRRHGEPQRADDCDDELEPVHLSATVYVGQDAKGHLPEHGSTQRCHIQPKLKASRYLPFPVYRCQHWNDGVDGKYLESGEHLPGLGVSG